MDHLIEYRKGRNYHSCSTELIHTILLYIVLYIVLHGISFIFQTSYLNLFFLRTTPSSAQGRCLALHSEIRGPYMTQGSNSGQPHTRHYPLYCGLNCFPNYYGVFKFYRQQKINIHAKLIAILKFCSSFLCISKFHFSRLIWEFIDI